MGTLVYLGADDGLLEASSRAARAAADGELVIVAPEGAPLLANPLFLETLRDLADGRQLVLVTADLRGRALASGVRIPAYASVGAYEQRTVDATEELEQARVEAIARIGRERRRRRAVQRRTVVAIALAMILLLAFVPSAEVTVAGEQTAIGPVELDVIATTAGSITATSFVTRLSASADGTASGSRIARVEATGSERVTNASTDRIDVAVGTLVWTASNVMFRTTQAKTIPPSTLFPFFVNEVQIPIEAVEAGTAGNVGRGEIRNVADRRLRVFNDQPTAGGEEKSFPVVMPVDYTAASTKLDRGIDAALRDQLGVWSAALPEDKRMEDHYATRTLSRTTSADVVGKEVDAFRLTASVEVSAFAVPRDEPRASAVRELARGVPAEHELVPESITVDTTSVKLAADGLTWHVVARGMQRAHLDEGALQLALAGQDRSSAASLLKDRGMKLLELSASPSWWPRLPVLPLRIGVRLAAGS
ncbi:MAG: hypothetical protein AUH85_04565 [Chloroflexi bacterium 13_1_40CM_4_68_4]|nr:MAG: hypothetical protein AUH85_04565 [Chloroflexi bacterium 13_1_40CM_4_68_4]